MQAKNKLGIESHIIPQDTIEVLLQMHHCKNRSEIFILNCYWNHTKFNFGMILVAIWYEYHTSGFAVMSYQDSF